MLFLLSIITELISVNGIRNTEFPPITGPNDYLFDQCVFYKLSKTAISFTNLPKQIQFSLKQSTFLDIVTQTDGSAFSLNTNAQTNCFLVCLANCYSSASGGAFYYNVNEKCQPSFDYVTINNCKSPNQVVYVNGDKLSQILLKDCNTSSCSSTGDDSSLIFLSNYCLDISHSTFAQNIASNSLLNLENSWGKLDECNLISNEAALLINFENSDGKPYSIVSSFFKNNGNTLTFKAKSSSINLNSCFIDYLQTSGSISSCNCIVGLSDLSAMTAYPFTFYSTVGCNAEIPYKLNDNSTDSKPENNDDEGSSTGIIIGVVAGVVCVIVAIIIILVLYKKFHREHSSESFLDVSEIIGDDPLIENVTVDPARDNMKVIDLFPRDMNESDPFELNFEERSKYLF